MSEHQVLVVGGGISGSAAALRAAQYHLRTRWIRGDRGTAQASRGRYVMNVDNMIGIHEGVLKGAMIREMKGNFPEAAAALDAGHFHIGTQAIIDNVVERLRDQYADRVDAVEARATDASRGPGTFTVETPGGSYQAPYLVLATGVADRQPRIKRALPSGKTLDEIHWIFPYANHETFLYCVRCEGHLTTGTPTAVIGFSPAAAGVAVTLHERYGTPVTILTNGEPPEFPDRTQQLLRAYGIGVRTERLVDVRGERPAGDLNGFDLEEGPPVDVRFAFVALGLHRVYNELAAHLGCELQPDGPLEERHVIVDEDSETSVGDCFAIGDMATHRKRSMRKQIYTAQEYAVRAVDQIDRRIRTARRKALRGD